MNPQQPPEQTVDPNQPFAIFVNNCVRYCKMMSVAALISQARMSYAGDPLVGQLMGSSGLLWEDATTVQQFIYLWYTEGGKILDDSFTAAIKTNPGPDVMWNWPYSKYGSLLKGA